MFNGLPTNDGTQRNPNIERGNIQARCDIYRVGCIKFGFLYHVNLQAWHVTKGEDPHHQYRYQCGVLHRCRELENHQQNNQCCEDKLQGRHCTMFVRKLPSPDITDGDGDTIPQQNPAHCTG